MSKQKIKNSCDLEELAIDFFFLGFMSTKEGYNGECVFEGLSPQPVFEDITLEELCEHKKKLENTAEYKELLDAALKSSHLLHS